MEQAGEQAGAGILSRGDKAAIAYHRTEGRGPGVVFLTGFNSDMTGEKALTLERICREDGRAFIRFDYQGHGRSSGRLEEGTIGLWQGDALAILDERAVGPQILVGSSLGGWIMLLVALARPDRIAGLVGVAPAADFTEDLMWGQMDEATRAELSTAGRILLPSAYGEPYPITLALIEEGRRHLLLNRRLPIACPIRLLHGMRDPDVPWVTSLRIIEAVESEDAAVTLVKDGDHRLSRPEDLRRLANTVRVLADSWEIGGSGQVRP